MWKHVAQLADDAIRRNHGLIRTKSVSKPFVDIKHMRAVRSAGADNLRGHGLRNILLLESEHRLQAAALRCVFGEGRLFLAQPRNLLLQLLILLARMAQIDVVVPHAAGMQAAAMHKSFDRCDECDRPAAKQGDLPAVRVAAGDGALDRTLNLYSQCTDLQQDDHDQDQRVSESEEEGIHLELKTGGSASYYPILTVRKM